MYQRFTCVGRATADAKRRKAKSGDVEFTTFGVAVNEGKDKVNFFDMAVFGKQGEVVAKFLKKGRMVLVDGRIEKNKGYANVIANRVVFLDSPKETSAEEGEPTTDESEPATDESEE